MICGRLLVFLVEDDQDTAMFYQALLAGDGWEVVHCHDCAQAKRPAGHPAAPRAYGEEGPPVMVLSAHSDPPACPASVARPESRPFWTSFRV